MRSISIKMEGEEKRVGERAENEHAQRDKLSYETTVHASALFGNRAEPFLFLALLCIVFCFRFVFFYVPFMAVCSSTKMLKRNSSVGKVLALFFFKMWICVYLMQCCRVRERIPVTNSFLFLCFVLVIAILQTIFIVQYTRDPTVTMQQFQWNLFTQNFFGRFKNFSNVRIFCIPFLLIWSYTFSLFSSPLIQIIHRILSSISTISALIIPYADNLNVMKSWGETGCRNHWSDS